MNGFDDRRGDPTVFGQPGARYQPQPYGAPQAGQGGQWQPGGNGQPGSGAPAGYPGQPQPDPTLQWRPAPSHPQAPYREVPPIEQYRDPYGAPPPGYQPGPGNYGPPPGSGGPQYPPPGRRGNGKVWLAVGLVALVVAAGATTAVLVAKNSGGGNAAAGTSPSLVSALTTTAGAQPSQTKSPSKTSTTKPAPSGNETPVIPGFQVVVSPDRGAAYDVPAGWTVASEDTIGGFGEPPNGIVGKGYAFEGKQYCPDSTRTVSFLTGSDNQDSTSAAKEIGTKAANLAYGGSTGTPGTPQPLNSLDGSQHGIFLETTGSVAVPKPGCAANYAVYTYATPTDEGNFVMVIAADLGVPNAVDTDTAKQIFRSIRPHE